MPLRKFRSGALRVWSWSGSPDCSSASDDSGLSGSGKGWPGENRGGGMAADFGAHALIKIQGALRTLRKSFAGIKKVLAKKSVKASGATSTKIASNSSANADVSVAANASAANSSENPSEAALAKALSGVKTSASNGAMHRRVRRHFFFRLQPSVLLTACGTLGLGLVACSSDEIPQMEASSVTDPVVFKVELAVLNQDDREFLNSSESPVLVKTSKIAQKPAGDSTSSPPYQDYMSAEKPEDLTGSLQRSRSKRGQQAEAVRAQLQSDLTDKSHLKTNIEKHLNSMPKISVKRVHLFRRQIEEEIKTALASQGYYSPVIYGIPHKPFRPVLPRRVTEGGAGGHEDKDSETQPTQSEWEVELLVDPGPPVIIRNLRIQVLGEGLNCSAFADIVKDSKLQKYTVLDHSAYEDLKSQLMQKAKALGFFDAEFSSSQLLVYKDQNCADIELILNTGRRYHFGALVASNRDREEKLLLPAKVFADRHLKEGSPFDTEKIGEFQSDMNTTNYYRSVDVTTLVDNRNQEDLSVPLEINLEPNNNHLFRVGGGYATDDGISFLFQWDMPRLNDNGNSLSTFARISQVSLSARMIYKIPVRDPNRDYNYIKLAQTYTDLNDTISNLSHISYHWVTEVCDWRLDAFFSHEFEDYTQGSEKGVSHNFMPGLSISRSSIEGVKYDPSWGYNISMDLTSGTAMLTDNNFFRVLATYKQILSPSEDTRVIFRLQQGLLTGQDALKVPPSLRFFVGGDQSVRGYGYKDESVRNSGGLKGGRYLSTATAEFQFPAGIDSARLAMFMDAGTACDDYNDSNIVYGPGIGFRYITPYGTVRVDIAYGLQRDSGLRLHFFFGPEL